MTGSFILLCSDCDWVVGLSDVRSAVSKTEEHALVCPGPGGPDALEDVSGAS